MIDYICTYCTIVCTCVRLYDYSICMCMGVLFQICDNPSVCDFVYVILSCVSVNGKGILCIVLYSCAVGHPLMGLTVFRHLCPQLGATIIYYVYVYIYICYVAPNKFNSIQFKMGGPLKQWFTRVLWKQSLCHQ